MRNFHVKLNFQNDIIIYSLIHLADPGKINCIIGFLFVLFSEWSFLPSEGVGTINLDFDEFWMVKFNF